MRLSITAAILGLLLAVTPSFSQISSCNLSLQAIPTGASCNNACNGSVTLVPTGGTAPYSFNAFDHSFGGTVIDTSVFAVRNGNFTVANNELTALANPSIGNDFDNSLATKKTFTDNGKIVIESSFYLDYNSYVSYGLAEDAEISDQSQLPFAFFFNYGQLYVVADGVWTQYGNYSANTWYDLKIEKLGSTVNYYMRNTGVSTYNLISSVTSTLTNPGYKVAAVYYNFYDNYGGFKTRNWRVGGNPPTTGLCPGTYTYTVYDAVGCYSTASVTIGAAQGGNSLQLSGNATGVSCQTSNDGAVALTPTGGVAPYTFGFAYVFGSTGGNINNSIFDLRNGNFSQGADLREGVNYNNNNSWDNSISTRQTFSDGGYLLYQASFKFDPNAEVIFGFTNTGTIDDYADVLFGFRVANGNLLYAYNNITGLQSLGSISSNTWYDFKIEKIGTNVYFYTRLTGSSAYVLRNTTSYSTTNIEYKVAALNFANFFSSSGGYNTTGWNAESTPKVSNLSPGTYTYTITDAAGCTATAVFNVTIGASNGVALNASLVSGSLSNGTTGSVNLNPSGGTAPYKYQFEESFTGITLNQSLFTFRNGSFAQSGDLRSNAVATNLSWDNSVSTKISFNDGGIISYAGSFKFDADATVYFGLTSNSSVINDPSLLQIGFYVSGGQLYGRAGANSNQLISAVNANTWYDVKVEKVNSLVKFYIRNGAGNYAQVYSMPYTGSATEFKAAAIAYGASAGFNTKNWAVNTNPSISSLAPGRYNYRVYDAKGCYASVVIDVPSTGTFSPVAQSTNTSAYNVCDGTASITSNVAGNISIASRLFYQPFTTDVINSGLFVRRNGSYSQSGNLTSATLFNNSGWDNSLVTSASFRDNGMIATEMEMNFRSASELYFGFVPNQSITGYATMPYAFYYASGKLYAYTAEGGSALIGVVSTNTWYSFKIEKAGSAVNFYTRLSTENTYQLVYTATTNNAAGNDYKIGVVNFYSFVGGVDRSFNSRNWKVLNNATLTGLCMGNYTYTVSLSGVASVDVNVTVGTNRSIAQTITAPAAVTVNTDPSKAFATNVTLGTPTFDGSTAGITVTNNAPAQFPLGVTTVTWTATDGTNTGTATQTVTVIDAEAPSITAPANKIVNALIGQTSVSGISLGTPVYTDNAPGTITVTNNAPAQYPIGVTVVTWTAKDAAGNTATATQTVTVVLTQIPTVIAPADVVKGTDAGKNFATNVALGTPTFNGNTAGLTVTNNAPSQYPLGTTKVTWTIRDVLGNTVTADQYVTIVDTEPPTATPPANVVVSTNTGVAYATNVTLGTPVYADNIANGITVTNNAPAQYPVGVTTVTWTVKDAAGNTTTATQTVTVRDTEKPVITAPANITTGTDAGKSFASNVTLGTPVYSDNVSAGVTVSNNAPVQYPIGTTTVTWTVKDAAGNTATATQTVTVNDTEKPTITAPANVTVTTTTGTKPTVSLGTPVFGDNVPAGVKITNDAPAIFPTGVTIVTWTVTDAAGNTATATQTVTVIENGCTGFATSITSVPSSNVYTGGNPNILYLGYGAQSTKLQVSVPAGSGYTYQWTGTGLSSTTSASPMFTPANDGNYTFTVTVKNSSNCTSTSTIKICVIDVRVLDSKGKWDGKKIYVCHLPSGNSSNSQTLSVSINAVDAHVTNHGDKPGVCGTICDLSTTTDTLPSVTAPADVTVNNNSGVAYATNVNLGNASFKALAGSTITNNAPAQFPVGTTVVTWTLKDKKGRTAIDEQVVTVVAPAPTITAPASRTVTAGANSCATNVALGTPVYTASVNPVTVTNNAPATFRLGTTAVTWTVRDGLGRTATATEIVTVVAPCQSYTASVTSVPTNNVYTGGVPTNLYIGYGPQSTKLQVSVPSSGAPYTYTWSGSNLSSTTSASPVFTPSAGGSYTFTVTVKNKYGCTANASITICVKDIRVSSTQGSYKNNDDDDDDRCGSNNSSAKVYITYYGTTYQVSAYQVSYYLRPGCGSSISLGRSNQTCGNTYARGVVAENIPDLVKPLNVLATPNPTSNFFVLRIDGGLDKENINVNVMDALGRVIYKQTTTAGSLLKFGETFTNGIYFAEVIQGNEKKVVKLMKN